jgi:hypothetical protein
MGVENSHPSIMMVLSQRFFHKALRAELGMGREVRLGS